MEWNNRSRRKFLKASALFPSILFTTSRLSGQAKRPMSKMERVKAILRAERVDRLPFTFWHHFGLENLPGEKHAEATVAFYRKFDPDLVKVMSDFPYPLPEGLEKIETAADWQRLEPLKNPFPEQVKALRLINKELKGQAPFVETIFQSWTVAEKLSSKKAVGQLKEDDPKLLKKVLRVISESQANHVSLALDAGAAGIFLAVAAADSFVMDPPEYLKIVRESDLIILDAVKEKGYLNILHVHGKKPHFETLLPYPVQVMNYSVHETGMNLATARKQFTGTLMGGLNETAIAKQTQEEIQRDIHVAMSEMQKRRFILSPGCSVPNDIGDEPLLRVRELVQNS
jgi:uroporphyrinogen decarboxylase